MEEIKIRGARIHNLKNIDISIPKNKLVIITGISGSGKSSLAFDILFEEGKNQYLKSLGILSDLEKEDKFDYIEGIGPTVAVRQNIVRQSNPRSTVGSKTGILRRLALLYASDGISIEDGDEYFTPGSFLYTNVDGMCVQCQGRGTYYTINIEELVPDKNETLLEVYNGLKVTWGFLRLLRKRFGEYFETPFWELPEDIKDEVLYGTYENGKQSYCIERILRNSLNKGEDVEKVYEKTVCSECHGGRISDDARKVLIHGRDIGSLGLLTLTELFDFIRDIPEGELSQFGRKITKEVLSELDHLIKFRLGHLSLYRDMSSLSGGEIQRIFLHLHLQSKMSSLIYVFDEPMSGLHPSEKESMIDAVMELRNLGNTVIVVEHDKDMIKHADYIIEIGPEAGESGGEVVYQGTYEEYRKKDTLLSQYLSGVRQMPERTVLNKSFNDDDCITIKHADVHYLKDIEVNFPLHVMVGVAGLSGSGKSSLIEDTLLKRLRTAEKYGHADGIKGENKIDGFVTVSQSPIGRSSTSTPASYIGIWDKIRKLFAELPEAEEDGLDAGCFSFNSKGACEECGGSGYERIFLTSDFSVDKVCPSCHGSRFNEETLSINYKEKTIADILNMSIDDAAEFFEDARSIAKPLNILKQMGMGYLKLGQPSSSLSGGESQRIKLAKELGRQFKGSMLYILDEPTTGLSMYDTAMLLKLLDKLVAEGNSVIVIEHNTEVLKKCDYIIELGPEGGNKGGEIIAKGTPYELKNNENSRTGRYL